MKIKILHIVYIFLLIAGSTKYHAQACCTAGTPLLGSLEMTSAPKGILQFGFTFDHNSLTDVFNGSSILRNQERERISESLLFEINYGLTNKISLTTLFSYIRQERVISQSSNKLSAAGIGDIVLMAKYSLIPFDIFNTQELSIGLGGKIPVGTSTLKDNGILLPADMQPGSGSWDAILWSYYSKGNFLIPNLTLIGNISYRLNGSNDRFENSAEGYSFGNEFITSIGFNYPLNTTFDLTFITKYRNAQNDVFGNEDIPNTGGNWIYFSPGISSYLAPNLSARLDGELPIFRKVSGTQLTTTFSASVSIFYTLNIFEGSFR